jgi:hypothetical protein
MTEDEYILVRNIAVVCSAKSVLADYQGYGAPLYMQAYGALQILEQNLRTELGPLDES